MLNKALFFIDSPSDADLHTLYSKATALIAASTVEGFGLPIIEAAIHNVPVIASDISIFHEVAGDGALYFSLDDTNSLAETLCRMKDFSPTERKLLVEKINVLTWKESAQRLLEIVLEGGSE
jgi:hypothetical protein